MLANLLSHKSPHNYTDFLKFNQDVVKHLMVLVNRIGNLLRACWLDFTTTNVHFCYRRFEPGKQTKTAKSVNCYYINIYKFLADFHLILLSNEMVLKQSSMIE